MEWTGAVQTIQEKKMGDTPPSQEATTWNKVSGKAMKRDIYKDQTSESEHLFGTNRDL